MSDRFDELDCMLWLDDVHIPADRVFAIGDECDQRGRDAVVGWLVWHQTIGWLARANFTLGLGIALARALGTREDPATVDALLDLAVETETIRACLAASELDPERTALGHALPRQLHVAPAAIHALRVRPEMDATLRRLAGAASLIAPGASDLDDDRIAPQLERAFGGGGLTARQRAALLGLAWDHLSSSLAGREQSYEMFGSGGLAAWRMRLRRWFDRDAEVVAAVRRAAGVDLGEGDGTAPR
jgi:4-hydroxyphenylacetate 3-monooxygenase